MKYTSIRFAIFFILISSYCGQVSAYEYKSDGEIRHVVFRLYQMTESMTQQCSRAPSALADKSKHVVSRFIETYPKLMTLVKQSPHYKHAQTEFALLRKYDQQTEEMLARSCGYISEILEEMIDTPKGIAEAHRLEDLLTDLDSPFPMIDESKCGTQPCTLKLLSAP